MSLNNNRNYSIKFFFLWTTQKEKKEKYQLHPEKSKQKKKVITKEYFYPLPQAMSETQLLIILFFFLLFFFPFYWRLNQTYLVGWMFLVLVYLVIYSVKCFKKDVVFVVAFWLSGHLYYRESIFCIFFFLDLPLYNLSLQYL